MYALSIVSGPDEGRVYPLQEAITVIGREPGKKGISLPDVSVSRRHARLSRHLKGYILEDMQSRNGTLLNDAPVEGQQPLNSGDLICVGGTTLRFSEQKSESDARAAREFFDAAATLSVQDLRSKIFAPRNAQADGEDELSTDRNVLLAVNRAAQTIHHVLDPKQLDQVICRTVMEHIERAEDAALLLSPAPGEPLACRFSIRREGTGSCHEEPAFSTTLARMALEDNKAILIRDAMQIKALAAQDSIRSGPTHSVLCVPLALRTGEQGVLIARSHKKNNPFHEGDLRLLTMIGLQSETAIEKASLQHRLEKEKTALALEQKRLKTAQQQLVQSERLAAVGRLSAEIVHDIRNPMTVILGHSQLLQTLLSRDGGEAEREMLFKSLREIESGISHANRIIDQLLQFSRQAKPEKTSTCLNELLQDTLRFLHPEIVKHKIEVPTDLDPSLPAAEVDPNQIRQVITNLIINAIQACAANGRLRISSLAEQTPRPRILLRFEDNGCGMTDDQITRIFEPFFTTKTPDPGKSGGSGLGLSVSYGIIRNHGGDIEVQSEKDKGTVFTLILPLEDA